MASGFLAGGNCFDTSAQAKDWYFSSKAPIFYMSGTTYNITQFVQINGLWYQKQDNISATGVVSPVFSRLAVYPGDVFCTAPYEYYFDGVAVGMGLLGLCAIAWCAYQIRRVLR